MILTIDFETIDYGKRQGLGTGWPWGACKVIGCGIKVDDGPTEYITDMATVKDLVNQADTIVAHSAQYEAGILHMLGVDIKNKTILCTLLGAKLYDNSMSSFSLDNLAKNFLGEEKKSSELMEIGQELGFITHKTRAKDQMWENLDRIQAASDVVAKYCVQDVDLTYRLYKIWEERLDDSLYKKYCQLINSSTLARARGVRVNIHKAYETMAFLDTKIIPLERKLWDKYGMFNMNSPKQVKNWSKLALGRVGHDSGDGKESFGREWVEQNNDHEDIRILGEIKKLQKLRTFCQIIIDHEKNGRVYPQLNILEAKTGRFSCTSPNLQQIPARDKEVAKLIRGLFIADEGTKLYSLDFSNQEGRIQVHYAYLLGCTGAAELKDRFDADPGFDIHQAVADMAGIERASAKTINLGLSYGMGQVKLARSLGVGKSEAREIRDKYDNISPYLIELRDKCEEAIKSKGFLKTLGGRHTRVDRPIYKNGEKITFEYRALNALIQGSAADQIIDCMLQAFAEDIPVLFPVHDQLVMSGTREQAIRLKEIMENAVNLEVPMVVDVDLNGGSTWAEAGH